MAIVALFGRPIVIAVGTPAVAEYQKDMPEFINFVGWSIRSSGVGLIYTGPGAQATSSFGSLTYETTGTGVWNGFSMQDAPLSLLPGPSLISGDPTLNYMPILMSGNDTIYGNPIGNTLRGYAGNDLIYCGAGSDSAFGDTGNDIIFGETGNDKLYGGTGNDNLYGGAGNDVLRGDSGADVLDGGAGTDRADFTTSTIGVTANLTSGSSSEFDQLISIENLYGSKFDDVLIGSVGANTLYGNLGNDQLFGLAGNDRLEGQAGDDALFGGDGNDIAGGGDGNDGVFGDAGNDTLYGGNGNDYDQ